MIRDIVKTITNLIRDIVAPPFCASCKVFLSQESVFCVSCYASIIPIITTQLSITASKKVTVFAISDYKHPIKKLIQAKHYKNKIAGIQLGQLMWQMTNIDKVDFDIIVPIPLHWTRYAYRGFNQAYDMSKIIAQESDKPIINLLRRTKKTRFQAELSGDSREQNVKGVFGVYVKNKNKFEGKHILLVDDLMTTGSTIKQAAKVLYTLRPRKITIVVAARTC